MAGGRGGGSARWLLTYSDMITLLLAFFVIMYAISKVDQMKYRAVALSLRGALGGAPLPAANAGGEGALPAVDPVLLLVERLRERLGRELAAHELQIEVGPDGILLRFPDRIFFERGKAELHAGARRILDKVAEVVGPLHYPLEAEGHTDTLPISSLQFPSNWELSVARATAVVRYLMEFHGLSPLRLAARGLGEHRPLYPNRPGAGEPRNRRVEVRILTK